MRTPSIAIILVSPQMGENIGAAARAMKNFGLDDLRIVNPRDGWPNPKADANAVGAIDIIHNAKLYDSLDDAIESLEYVYATTAQMRSMNKDYTLSKNLRENLQANKKIGIMFGRESSGLQNQEIALANEILTIDTDPNFSSLNIAHAVAIVSYELFQATPREDLSNAQELATKGELQHLFDHLFGELEGAKFFKIPEKRQLMKQNIINIFSRIENLSHSEAQTLRGIITSLSAENRG
ncbi:MAG: RNA methyltransferase [Pseudomonadota bacterium]